VFYSAVQFHRFGYTRPRHSRLTILHSLRDREEILFGCPIKSNNSRVPSFCKKHKKSWKKYGIFKIIFHTGENMEFEASLAKVGKSMEFSKHLYLNCLNFATTLISICD
jgi:hypothetical protein